MEWKSLTEICENIYLMTMIRRTLRQILGFHVARDNSAERIQEIVPAVRHPSRRSDPPVSACHPRQRAWQPRWLTGKLPRAERQLGGRPGQTQPKVGSTRCKRPDRRLRAFEIPDLGILRCLKRLAPTNTKNSRNPNGLREFSCSSNGYRRVAYITL